MPVFFPTHPEPGEPPGFYGEVYFDGQKTTDRRKPGADPAHYQMSEWYVPAVSETETSIYTEIGMGTEIGSCTDIGSCTENVTGAGSFSPEVRAVEGTPTAALSATNTPESASHSGATSDSSQLFAPIAEHANVPLTRPTTAAGHHRAAGLATAGFNAAGINESGASMAGVGAAGVSMAGVGAAGACASSSACDTDQSLASARAPGVPEAPLVLSSDEVLARFNTAIAALEQCPTEILHYDRLDNATVQELQRKNGEIARLAGIRMAITTDQIAQRSAADLAGQGMARQFGDRTAIEMAKNLGGLTQQDVMAALNAGRMMRDAQSTQPDIEPATPTSGGDLTPVVGRPAPPVGPAEPWLRSVSEALTAGVLSPAQATAIRRGLGTPTEAISAAVLTVEATRLVDEAQSLTPDKMWKLARQTRDRLDRDGVALREAERYRMRSARLTVRPDGMVHLNWVMGPEQGMRLKTLCDRITSPKRGGPRTSDSHTAQRLKDDPREIDQLLSDHLFHFLEAGAGVDPSSILATPTASVVVLTTRRRRPHTVANTSSDTSTDTSNVTAGSNPTDGTTVAAKSGTAPEGGTASNGSTSASGSTRFSDTNGTASDRPTRPAKSPNPHDPGVDHHPIGQHTLGWIEGHPDPLSPETVDRLICEGSTHEAIFTEDLFPLDVRAEQRLFGRKQRIGLGAQFGGCTWTDENGNRSCDRPPSWSEAHHIEHWYRDQGRTVMSNGILLCKSHHLQLHNDHWEIIRKGNSYWLIPPATVDPARIPRLIPTRSNVHRDLLDESA
jgi:hypothetical protein